MDYYTNACEQLEGAELLAGGGKYRLAVTNLCLSFELFLKSLAERKDPDNPLLNSHDLVNLGYMIQDDIDFKALVPKLKLMRKYLNDSRYPYNPGMYTKEFYDEIHESIMTVQREVDAANTKKSDIERLGERFGKDYIADKRR